MTRRKTISVLLSLALTLSLLPAIFLAASADTPAVELTHTKSGDTITIDMPDDKVREIIENASDNTAVLDVSDAGDVTEVFIPSDALDSLLDEELSIELRLPFGTVTLDTDVLASMSPGDDISVSLFVCDETDLSGEQNASVRDGDLVLSIAIFIDGEELIDFDGTLTVTVPYGGGSPVAVWYMDEDGKLEMLDSTYSGGYVTFKATHLSVFVIGQQGQNTFTDVPGDAWYYNDVAYVVSSGLMNGVSDTAFDPDLPMTRAMLVTILYRAAGSPEVDSMYAAHMMDVGQGEWYEDAMGWALSLDIINGYGEGFYGPGDYVTREQFAVFLYRYVQSEGGGFEGTWAFLLEYADIEAISDWAYEAVCWCTVSEIITGRTGGLFDPQGLATRAEAAAMLHRFIEA